MRAPANGIEANDIPFVSVSGRLRRVSELWLDPQLFFCSAAPAGELHVSLPSFISVPLSSFLHFLHVVATLNSELINNCLDPFLDIPLFLYFY